MGSGPAQAMLSEGSDTANPPKQTFELNLFKKKIMSSVAKVIRPTTTGSPVPSHEYALCPRSVADTLSGDCPSRRTTGRRQLTLLSAAVPPVSERGAAAGDVIPEPVTAAPVPLLPPAAARVQNNADVAQRGGRGVALEQRERGMKCQTTGQHTS